MQRSACFAVVSTETLCGTCNTHGQWAPNIGNNESLDLCLHKHMKMYKIK